MARINNVVSFYLFKGNFPGLVVLSGQMYGLRVCVCACVYRQDGIRILYFPLQRNYFFTVEGGIIQLLRSCLVPFILISI